MSDPSVTSKEISPGIILHKQQIQNKGDPDIVYIFKVEVMRLNILEFTADFSGSENVILEGKNNLISTTTIDPFKNDIIAKLILKKDWKLKSKFKFTLKPTPRETQLKYISQDLLKVRNEIQAAAAILRNIPISILPINDAFKILSNHNMRYVDIEFPPIDDSAFGSVIDPTSLENAIHWRRPREFFEADANAGLREPQIFYESIEPNDIRQGTLGDGWFMSALAAVAERPALVERLFITKEINPQGIYRVKICKNGEWVTVTVDDFFPCFPMGGPVFSRAHGNELWVMLLEKAYAKLHGSYYLLRGGFANEGLIDLTGCPSMAYYFDDDEVEQMIKTGKLWDYMKQSDEDGFLMTASTPGEDRWNELPEPDDELGGLIPGHSYTVLQVKEYKNFKLLNLRNPWGNFDWKGDFSDNSPLWTKELINEIQPSLGVDDGCFWMTYKDFLSHYKCLNVCKVRNWDEIRIKGKFIRVQDIDDPNIEIVLSKWYYSVDLQEKTKIMIGIHQEDVRTMGVAARRPYIDIGVIVLKRTSDGGVVYVASRDLSFERQVELELDLDAGSYIILPRTTGCTLRRPFDAKHEMIKMIQKSGRLHELVESSVMDIFRKFDMLLNRELTYLEFKGFYECLNKNISEKDFKTQILDKFASTTKGLSMRGFLDFWRESIINFGEEIVWQWFDLLGYDKDLYSIRSRCFLLTLHSESEVSVTVRDAIQTDLDNRANILLIQKFGQSMEAKKGIRGLYTFSKEVHAYSYGVVNDQATAIEVTLDCSNSTNMLFSTKTPIAKKRVEPGQLEFIMHAEALPTASDFVRATKCMWTPISE